MKPRLFIGSSMEGKHIADAIQDNFSHDSYPTVWNHMVFTPSTYPLESLLSMISRHDFAVLVLSPDDVLTMRGATAPSPRGNVLFEAALFIGRYGRDRCFLVQPRGTGTPSLPTDLLGIIPATYDQKHSDQNAAAALGPACTQIRGGIEQSTSFRRALTITPSLKLADPASSPLHYPKNCGLQ